MKRDISRTITALVLYPSENAKEREKVTTIQKDMVESIRHYLIVIDLNNAKAMLRYGKLHIHNLHENSKPMEGASSSLLNSSSDLIFSFLASKQRKRTRKGE